MIFHLNIICRNLSGQYWIIDKLLLSKCGPWLAASAAPEILLEMQNLKPYPRTME